MKKKTLLTSLLILALLVVSLPVSAASLEDIVLDGSTVEEEITLEGTALPNTWVSIKVTDKDNNIVFFSGVKTGEDPRYSLDLDLIGNSLPLDVTVTYGDNVETFQIKEKEHEPVPVDKSALNAKIAEAELLDGTKYTKDSWAVLKQALTSAKEVAEKQDATQEEVDSALEALVAAIYGLKEKEKDPGTDDPEPGDYDLVIKGKGVSKTTYFTIEQLKKSPEKKTRVYDWLNNFGSRGSDEFEGIYLEDLLNEVGLKSNAKSITVKAADGYERSFNLDSKPLGVYWKDIQGNQLMLAWEQNGVPCGIRLVVGQIDEDYVNKSLWVSDVVEITVNTSSSDSGSGTPGKYEGKQDEEELIEEDQTGETIRATVNIEPKIEGDTAVSSISASEVAGLLEQIKEEQSKEDKDFKVVMEINAVSGKQVNKAEVILSEEVVKTLENEKSITVAIKTDLGEIELSPETLKELSGSSDVKISIGNSGDESLDADSRAKIGNRPVVDITITKGDQGITEFNGKSIKVGIPYKAKSTENHNKLLVYYINENGQSIPVILSKLDNENNKMVFATNHLGLFAVGYNDVSFDDVKDHWAKDNIEFLASREILKGKGAGIFDPNGNVTRAEFVTMLANLTDKAIAGSASSGFDDVLEGAWYYDYVNWAVAKGIVQGYGNGKFGPNDKITREQMAVMMDNFLTAIKADLDIKNEKISFTDQSQISSWAVKAVSNMQQYGIISGRPGGIFDPKGTATRAEAATILKGYIDSLMK